jgi:type I restriction enzyme S subunit
MIDNDLPELPKGWVWTTLGEVRLEKSHSIAPNQAPSTTFELYSVPSFDTKYPQIIQGKEIGSNKQIVDKDTVLLCKINPRINRVWVVGNYSPHPKIASTEWIPFAKVGGIEPKYVRYFMQNSEFRDFLSVNVSGVGGSLMRINPSKFAKYPFPLPPPPEQHRIIAKIEELFTKLDGAVETLKIVQLQLERYRQSVLKSAFNGILTAEWREDHKSELEPANALLEKIKRERKKNGNCKDFPPLDTTDLPDLPEGWAWTTIPSFADMKLGKMLDKEKNKGVLMQYLRNVNVRWDKFELFDLKEMRFEEGEIEKYKIKDGDVVVCEGGEPGRAGVWSGGDMTIQFQKALHRLRVESGIVPKWLVYHIWNDANSNRLHPFLTGTTIKHLTGESLKRYPIVLASQAEQMQIVGQIEYLLSNVDQMQASIEKSLKQAERLRQSILKMAFEGRLVPQDPNDEPAHKLLDKIKAERTNTEINSKQRKSMHDKRISPNRSEGLELLHRTS